MHASFLQRTMALQFPQFSQNLVHVAATQSKGHRNESIQYVHDESESIFSSIEGDIFVFERVAPNAAEVKTIPYSAFFLNSKQINSHRM